MLDSDLYYHDTPKKQEVKGQTWHRAVFALLSPWLRNTILFKELALNSALTSLLYHSGYGETVATYDLYAGTARAPEGIRHALMRRLREAGLIHP